MKTLLFPIYEMKRNLTLRGLAAAFYPTKNLCGAGHGRLTWIASKIAPEVTSVNSLPQVIRLVWTAARARNWSESKRDASPPASFCNSPQLFRARCFPKKRSGEPAGRLKCKRGWLQVAWWCSALGLSPGVALFFLSSLNPAVAHDPLVTFPTREPRFTGRVSEIWKIPNVVMTRILQF